MDPSKIKHLPFAHCRDSITERLIPSSQPRAMVIGRVAQGDLAERRSSFGIRELLTPRTLQETFYRRMRWLNDAKHSRRVVGIRQRTLLSSQGLTGSGIRRLTLLHRQRAVNKDVFDPRGQCL